MSLNELVKPHFWQTYSKKMKAKLKNPKFSGYFTVKMAEEKKLRFVSASDGSIEDGSIVKFYLLVDEVDGVICDIKFQALAPSALIAIAEVFCSLALRKNYDQVSRITANLIEQNLQDKKANKIFSSELGIYFNQIINTIDQIVDGCSDIPFKRDYDVTPIKADLEEKIIENFETFDDNKKRAIIESIIDQEIKPFVELDAGGVHIKDLKGFNVFISYEGSCTSCPAATGSTLFAIEKILKTKVHPDITVSAVM